MEQEKRREMMTPEIEARSVELLDVAIVNRWSPHALEEKRKMVEITDAKRKRDPRHAKRRRQQKARNRKRKRYGTYNARGTAGERQLLVNMIEGLLGL